MEWGGKFVMEMSYNFLLCIMKDIRNEKYQHCRGEGGRGS